MRERMTAGQTKEARETRSRAISVGCAGWSIPPRYAHEFDTLGSHLHRYSQIFNCCEINSSFRRNHKPVTWQRWAASVPHDFRFSVKVPRTITHEARLKCAPELLIDFLEQIRYLDSKLGPLLLQTPPSLEFEIGLVSGFFSLLRQYYAGEVVCEPRHGSWFLDRADHCLQEFHVGRVASDPACVAKAADTGGSQRLAYFRLHGSPRLYYSRYPEQFVKRLAKNVTKIVATSRAWCMFDNIASGSAFENALQLRREFSIDRNCTVERDPD
jgi:uncharacterized protein YecE (DUF72 family)